MISAGTSLPIAQECCLKCPACGALKDARSKADRAVKARSAARSEIVRVCAQSVKLLGGGTIAEGKAMPSWDLTGNAGTTDANFLGTKDRRPLVIKTNNSEAMRIEPGGKVGIGTMEPNAPLQIGSDTYTQDSKIILDAGNGAQRRAWSMGVPYGDTTVTSPNYGFVIRDETGGTDRFVIDWQTGNTGIGTTSPLHMLQVGGGFDGNLGLDGSDGSPNAGYIRFGDTTGWKLHFTRQREVSGGDLNTGDTGALVTIQDNGNVGIATTSPGVPLDVAGDAQIAGMLFGNDARIAGTLFGNRVAASRMTVLGRLNAFLLTATIKLFRIDHPLDPANKYLSHASVESPDLKTFYDGIAELYNNGEAVVELPEWFETLNKDFRYQLTGIGGFAPVYIAEEITNNRFKISGGKPGTRISWQVTGIRHDPVAKATPMMVEEDKPDDEKGSYQNPEAYGQPEESAIRFK